MNDTKVGVPVTVFNADSGERMVNLGMWSCLYSPVSQIYHFMFAFYHHRNQRTNYLCSGQKQEPYEEE